MYIIENNTHYNYENKMRTNIVIDDNLMKLALVASSFKTKKATIEDALALLIKTKRQAKMKNFRGMLKWEGNIEEMRKV